MPFPILQSEHGHFLNEVKSFISHSHYFRLNSCLIPPPHSTHIQTLCSTIARLSLNIIFSCPHIPLISYACFFYHPCLIHLSSAPIFVSFLVTNEGSSLLSYVKEFVTGPILINPRPTMDNKNGGHWTNTKNRERTQRGWVAIWY